MRHLFLILLCAVIGAASFCVTPAFATYDCVVTIYSYTSGGVAYRHVWAPDSNWTDQNENLFDRIDNGYTTEEGGWIDVGKFGWNGAAWALIDSEWSLPTNQPTLWSNGVTINAGSPRIGGQTNNVTYMTTNYPNGCSDIQPPDPCEGKEPDVDTDLDGICDRCDFVPDDATKGRYIYEVESYQNSEGTVVAQDYTFVPYTEYVNLSEQQKADNTYYNDNESLGDATRVTFNQGSFPVVGEVAECACDTPCTINPAGEGTLINGPKAFPGTEAPDTGNPPVTVPQPAQPSPAAPNPAGDPLEPDTVPETGTDNEFLKNIADNTAKTVDNLGTMNDNLSQQLAGIENQLQRGLEADNERFEQDTLTSSQIENGVGAMSSAVESEQDSEQQTLKNEIQSLSDNAPLDESLFDGVTQPLDTLMQEGDCTPLVYEIPSINQTFTLSCEFSDHLKTFLAFLVSVWTITELIDTLFTGITPKGTSQLPLFGKK